MSARQITIIGLGLIGGSIAAGLKHNGFLGKIAGVDQDDKALRVAKDKRWIDFGTKAIEEGVQDSDVVIFATPVGIMTEVCKKAKDYLKQRCIVTDVGSTKAKVQQTIEKMLPSSVSFVGGHPMAGSHSRGIEAASHSLFENAIYLLTVTENTPMEAVQKIQELVHLLKAFPLIISPDDHDKIIAAVSHLPHLLAVALMNAVGEIQEADDRAFLLAAGGFRDTTRIAASDPLMWRDIFLSNRDYILSSLKLFSNTCEKLKTIISTENSEELYKELSRARNLRENISCHRKEYYFGLFEMSVEVEDKPGVLAEITAILAQKRINISDIEILHSREEGKGTLRLGFKVDKLRAQALKLLAERGYSVKLN